MTKAIALTIAGSDPTGGAGIQADLKTFAAHKVHGASVISVLTAQNINRFEICPVSASFIDAQIEAVFERFDVKAIKIGMLANRQTVATVVGALKRYNSQRHIPVVLDPVVRASNGGLALDQQGVVLLREELLPLTSLIKPNIREAALLLGEAEATTDEQMRQQALRLGQSAGTAVLLSGGHLAGPEAIDILYHNGEINTLCAKKLEKTEFHGTGCTLTSSITANLALGHGLVASVNMAKNYLFALMQEKASLDEPGQSGFLDHLAILCEKSSL